LLAAIGVVGATTCSAAETKTNILGYRTGMSEDEVARECKTISVCDKLSFEYSKLASPRLVQRITYTFSSGTDPAGMIDYISQQFGAKPTKADWSAEIQKATNSRFETMPGIFGGSKTVVAVGGLICRWKLRPDLLLELTLNYPSHRDTPNQYFMTISDDTVAQVDRDIVRSQRQEQEQRARQINPKPGF
jgi:hypothetical protein